MEASESSQAIVIGFQINATVWDVLVSRIDGIHDVAVCHCPVGLYLRKWCVNNVRLLISM
jgi:hypothetical protein